MLPRIGELGSYAFHAHALLSLATGLAIFALGAVVAVRERASRASSWFFVVTLTAGTRLTAFGFLYAAVDSTVALWWAKLAYLSVPLIPTAVYHFTTVVLGIERRRKPVLAGFWATSVAFVLAAVATDWLVAGLYRYPWGFYPRYGWLSPAYVALFVAIMVVTLVELGREYLRSEAGKQRLRIRSLLVGFSVAYLAAVDFLPKFGVAIYPFGYIPVLGFVGIVAWTIRRHRLVDLTPSYAAREIIATMADPLLVCDDDGIVRLVNDAACEVFGYDEPELVGRGIDRLVRPSQRERLDSLLQRQPVRDAEMVFRTRDGGDVDVSVSISRLDDPLRGPGGVAVGSVVIARDIRDRKRAEEQLRHDAFHDSLTGLPNRALALDRLGRMIERGRRRMDFSYAVLFLDFDRFKVVNESLGHDVGDALLVAIAARFQKVCRAVDTVARLGGDEFVILLEDVGGAGGAEAFAERLEDALSRPFVVDGREVFTSASIGIVVGNREYERPEDLLRDADIAMYRAKASGKAQHRVFDAEMRDEAVQRLTLETDLRRALERDELFVQYQPILSLETLAVCGFEALVRWRHPRLGIVSPGQFIPVAEDSDLIYPIDLAVLRRGCLEVRAWDDITDGAPLTLNVNLSGQSFARPDLLGALAETLDDTDMDPGRLRVEITESVVMEEPERGKRVLKDLRELGVGLHVDDFGTGYSSLSYLHHFPISVIKIDRSFIANVTEGGRDADIVETIVSLAADLEMETIAEGVETVEQLAHVEALGCHYAQGFLISRPLDAEVVREWLAGGSGPIWQRARRLMSGAA